ncbi:MAG: L,D-transpeptidase family protein [Amphiplicatus sp.]
MQLWIIGFVLAIMGCVNATELKPERWDRDNVGALIAAVSGVSADGLNPTDYDVSVLEAAVLAGDQSAIDEAATGVFSQLATDLSQGKVAPDDRPLWHIERSAIDLAVIRDVMNKALAEHRVGEALAAFVPTHPQYKGLRAALGKTPLDDEKTARLRVNMERWRWMPRELGSDYILVNVAAIDVIVVRNGVEIDRRKVIIGAPKRPTLQFSTMALGVAFNPIWYVPADIAEEQGLHALLERDPAAAARRGYYLGPDGGVRQKPGPRNALGRMKLLMPNPFAIFLHDTPEQTLFKRESRALSHGCIRVENALDFAHVLLEPDWSADAIADIVATTSTVTVDFKTPTPVYVAYFTATPNDEGTVSFQPDIYGLDPFTLCKMDARAAPKRFAQSALNAEQGCPTEALD